MVSMKKQTDEWLTTGQMIDQLKIGEIAIPDDDENLAIKRIKEGFIWVNLNEHGQPIPLQGYLKINHYTLNLKWRILPQYVSFEEAKEAFRQGKVVHCHIDDEVVTYSPNDVCLGSQVYAPSWHEILEGKWTIEE